MNKRPRARTQKETPATANRSRSLEGLGTTYRLRRSLALVNVLITCRALPFPRPDLGAWPQFDVQPLLQPGNGSEVGEHLASQHPVNRQSVDPRLPLDSPQGEALPCQCFTEAQRERLGVASTHWSSRIKASIGPRSGRDVLARSGVTSRPWHGLRLPIRPCVVCAPCYSSGYYKIHSWELPCLAMWSSAVTS